MGKDRRAWEWPLHQGSIAFPKFLMDFRHYVSLFQGFHMLTLTHHTPDASLRSQGP